MKTIQHKQLLLFIFYIFLIEKILSSPKEILNKYSSIKTKYNYIFFNISEFKYEEDIYLTLKSESKCDEMIKKFDIGYLRGKNAKKFSGGEQQ